MFQFLYNINIYIYIFLDLRFLRSLPCPKYWFHTLGSEALRPLYQNSTANFHPGHYLILITPQPSITLNAL